MSLLPFLILFNYFSCKLYGLQYCDNSFCNNAGLCTISETDSNEKECKCAEELFTGSQCNEIVDLCNPNPCENDGICR